MNKLKNYEKIITDDKSTTYYSKLYGETCHSTTGAASETDTHYVQGCDLENASKKYENVNIFEVGFGAGVGFIQTLKYMQSIKKPFNFISTEIDFDFIEGVLEELNLEFVKVETDDLTYYRTESDLYKLIILAGDARKTIKHLQNIFNQKFHGIYQDAFSPKRNADLWTQEWFEDLKAISHKEVVLSTYSASSSIRKSLIAAGWTVYNGVEFGKKRSSTRAKLTGETSQEILSQLERSPAPLLTDNNYKDYTLENK